MGSPIADRGSLGIQGARGGSATPLAEGRRMNKIRLDVLLQERGLAESRQQAQRLIMAGKVSVDGALSDKPGRLLAPEVAVKVREPDRYVGRGGLKLEAALKHFSIDVRGLVCLDIGASTGGFTDCLLQHGAARVHALDVGRGQLHQRLRQDGRVVIHEGFNARYLEPHHIGETPDVATVDVSFISLRKILPALCGVLRTRARMITLIKPQFEAGRAHVARGGVVRDAAVRAEVVGEIRRFGEETLSLLWIGSCTSPLRGPAGNIEILACWEKP